MNGYLDRADAAPICAAALDLGAVLDGAEDWPADLVEGVILAQLAKITAEAEKLRQIYRAKKGLKK